MPEFVNMGHRYGPHATRMGAVGGGALAAPRGTEGAFLLSVRRDWNRLEAQGLHLGRKVKDRDIILFNQELVALLKAGYPILKSLETISSRVKNLYLQEIRYEEHP